MRFSVIVPVYNSEKYLNKCFESIINQTNQDFELLIINDGSPDNSQEIITKYQNKYPLKIKSFTKENGGLSDARNYGVAKARGEYIVFVDSDDFINTRLLEHLELCIKHDFPDVVGYNFVDMDQNYKQTNITTKPHKSNISGEEAISELVLSKQYFEPAWGFAYNLDYWKSNKFEYIKGLLHEDFALTPLVIVKANKVSFIDFDGYYYIKTSNSITRNLSIEKEQKLAKDLLKGFDFLNAEVQKINFNNEYAKKLLMSYLANSLIYRLENIHPSLKSNYRQELIRRNISNYIIDDTFKRKIRKIIIKVKNKL